MLATLLGVFMVGALIATMINIKIGFAPQIGELTVDIQEKIDMVLPRIVPGRF